jgi:hypothetical protein
MLLDCALVDPEPASQFVDGDAFGVALDQFFHSGWI